MMTGTDKRREVSRWKWCWKCLSTQLFIKHDLCNRWHCTKHEINEIDDDFGFPHYGYPVCLTCKEPMRQFKSLVQCLKYEGHRTLNNDLVTYNPPFKIGNFYMIGIKRDSKSSLTIEG